MRNANGEEIHGTRFTFEYWLMSGNATIGKVPYRSLQWWKTPKGALNAAIKHHYAVREHYDREVVDGGALVIVSDLGEFVTNAAA